MSNDRQGGRKSTEGSSRDRKQRPPRKEIIRVELEKLLCADCVKQVLVAPNMNPYEAKLCEDCASKLARWCARCKRLFDNPEIISKASCVICRRGIPEIGTKIHGDAPLKGIVFTEGDNNIFFTKLRPTPDGEWVASTNRDDDRRGLKGLSKVDLTGVPIIEVKGHARSMKSVFVSSVGFDEK